MEGEMEVKKLIASLVLGLGLVLGVLLVLSTSAQANGGGFLNIIDMTTEPELIWPGNPLTTTVELRAQWGLPAAETTTLTVTLPGGLQHTCVYPVPTISATVVVTWAAPITPGYHQITAETWRSSDGGGDFVPRWIYVHPDPFINLIDPPLALPGQRIWIRGYHFLGGPPDTVGSDLQVWFISPEGGVNWVDVYTPGVIWEGETISLILPTNLQQGKAYIVKVLRAGRVSNGVEYQVGSAAVYLPLIMRGY